VAVRITEAKEGILLEFGNSYYLFSLDAFGNHHEALLLRTSTKLDLSHRAIQNVKEVHNFLWNSGVGMFRISYHVPLTEIVSLFKQKLLSFEIIFVPEEVIEKAEDDCSYFQ
jgi:hypothetical protein